jgi:hypothetical protein
MNPDETPADPRTELAALASATEATLTETYGAPVRLGEPELLRERYRNKVARFPVADGPAGVPASVVVKTVEAEEERGFDPDGDAAGGPASRFYNEWAGNRFLNEVGASPPVNARLLGANRAAGLIVLEDLGAPRSLADAMQADDRAALEAALLQYAAGMGRLHAVSAGRVAEFERVRRAIGGAERPAPGGTGNDDQGWRDNGMPAFVKACADLQIPVPSRFQAEAEAVIAGLHDAGPFLAFKPGDTCPDNHFLATDGGVRFFDFEFAGFGHALIDAAYFYLPFPTCWCVNRLPDAMVGRMEEAYRRELAVDCPAAADDAVFLPALARACAFWAVTTLSWTLEKALDEDRKWGISTVRQRHPLRLDNAAQVAERVGTLPAMAETFRALADALRVRWPDTEPMPFYPAFRDKVSL